MVKGILDEFEGGVMAFSESLVSKTSLMLTSFS